MPEEWLLAGGVPLAVLAAVCVADALDAQGSPEGGPPPLAPIIGGVLGIAAVLAVGAACSLPG